MHEAILTTIENCKRMNKVLITCASGFIGSSLATYLSGRGHEVRGLVRKYTDYLPEKLQILGDLDTLERCRSFLDHETTVFHSAGVVGFSQSDYQQAYRVNVEGTRKMLDLCREAGVAKFVHLSACAVLGYSESPEKVLDEGATPVIKQSNAYAYTKKLAENLVYQYGQEGLFTCIANIATVYGYGDRKMNSGSTIHSILNGKMKIIPPGGTSYVALTDLLRGLELLAEKGACGERYILSSENLSYRMLVSRIANVLSVTLNPLTAPGFTRDILVAATWLMERVRPKQEGRINLVTPQIISESFGYKYFSHQKAQHALGWTPEVPLEQAVLDAVGFYRKEKLIV